MLADDFEIYYYSDTDFKSVSPHVHDYYEFYIPLAGSIRYEIQRTLYDVSPTNVILVPPGLEHRALNLDRSASYTRIVFWLSRKYTEKITQLLPDTAMLLHRADSGRFIYSFTPNEILMIRSQLMKILEEVHTSRFGRIEFLETYIHELLLYMNRIIYEQENTVQTSDAGDLLQNLLSYIDVHIDEKLTLDAMAETFSVSKFYISHLFKDNLGISMHQYIMHKRITLCALEIICGKPIKNVYHEHGIEDYSSFYRAFRKEYSLSPKEFQAVYLKDPARHNSLQKLF